MSKSKVIAMVVGGLAVGCIAFVVMLLLLKGLWAWTVPDLFPGAVEQGLVARTISWWTAVKIALFAAILSGFLARPARRHKE